MNPVEIANNDFTIFGGVKEVYYLIMGFVPVENITSGFCVAVCLFSDRSQKASNCGKSMSDTLGYRLM